jgi:hypothetical protein
MKKRMLPLPSPQTCGEGKRVGSFQFLNDKAGMVELLTTKYNKGYDKGQRLGCGNFQRVPVWCEGTFAT